jgi:AraC-like DNA-binding protein
MWARFGITFVSTFPAAIALLRDSPGGVVILDPALAERAVGDLLGAARAAAADIVLYVHWDNGVASRILAALRTVVPVDIMCAGVDDSPNHLARVIDGPFESSVRMLALEKLADAIERLPVNVRAAIIEPFVSVRLPPSALQLAVSHGLVPRTFERYLTKAGIVPPSDILRGAGVARARDLMTRTPNALSIIAEGSGLRSTTGLRSAFRWAVGVSPREAVTRLPSEEFARRLADSLLLRD